MSLLTRSVIFSCKYIKYRPISTCNKLNDIFKYGNMSQYEEKYRKKDKVPNSYKLIYRVNFDKYADLGNGASLCGFGGLATYLTVKFTTISMSGLSITTVLNEFLDTYSSKLIPLFIFGVGYLFFCISLRIVATRCILRVYSDDAEENPKYLAVLGGNIPLTVKHFEFTKDDAERANGLISRKMPWSDDYFYIKNKGYFLIEERFRVPQDFHTLFNKKSDE